MFLIHRGCMSACLALLLAAGSACSEAENELADEQARPNACSLLERTESVLGPLKFFRSTGKPDFEEATFQVDEEGELCVLVFNGRNPPPHGQRVSSAWLQVDGEQVIGPDAFSQQVVAIKHAYPVAAGEHVLGAMLASKPGSFLEIELRFLAKDTEPPLIAIQPADGSEVSTDMPLIKIGYQDEGVGVDTDTLSIRLEGEELSGRFEVSSDEATWQVEISSYLEEGRNHVEARVSDWMGNAGIAASTFLVHTPTEVLLEDLGSEDSRYRKRSAYKLLFRTSETGRSVLRRCLKQLNETPETKAVDRLMEIAVDSSVDHLSRSLAAGAIGETAGVDPATRGRDAVVDMLGRMLLEDESFVAKAAASRALGLTRNQRGIAYLEQYISDGPERPAKPLICSHSSVALECMQYEGAVAAVGIQVTRALTRIAGQGHTVGNPGDLMEIRAAYLDEIESLLSDHYSGQGGRP